MNPAYAKEMALMGEMSEKLLELLTENPDIQEFMNRITQLLENPVMMVDAHYRILYYSQREEITNPLWTEALTEHYVSDGIIDSMQKSEIIEKLKLERESFLMPLPGGFQALRVPLFFQGESCGFLGMYDYLRPFTEGDGRRLELAAKALTVLLQADPDILRRLDDRRDDLLLELLKCESRELAQIISRRNGSMGMGREKILVCVTKRQEQAPSRSAALGRLKDFLKAGLCYHASAVYSDCLLLLFSEDQVSGSLLDAAFAVLQDCCVRYDLYAGVSFSFGEDSSIPLADKQALKAALFGTGREKKRERISYYEDFMIKDVINAALRLHTPSFYEHPVITKILAYDRECGTRYLDTLRSYLYSFCNMKATALEMKVHYNTVKYRISMIEEISGRDLKDDRDLLRRLLCSLQILDFAREYDRN